MKVLLIQAPWTLAQDIPLVVQMPLGLLYVAAYARAHGHEVTVLDSLAEGHRRAQRQGERVTYGLSEGAIRRRIRATAPDVVGISVPFSVQFGDAERVAGLVKGVDDRIVTVMGGIHPTVHPEQVLEHDSVDYVLRGEGEESFVALLEALEAGNCPTDVDGIAFRQADGTLRVNPKRSFIEDLDALPFPAWDLLDLEPYFEAGLVHGFERRGRRSFNIITSRGCPAACSFCTIQQVTGRRFRARSPDSVLAEIGQLVGQYGAEHLQFEDDNLTFDIPRAKAIFRGMIQRGLDLPWNTPNGIALWRMDRECLALMRDAGCYYVSFALESGSQRVLDELMHKPLQLEAALPLVPYARSLGMKVAAFFVVGNPGETKAEMQLSFDLPYRVELDWVEYSIATPYGGTELRAQVEEQGQMRVHALEDLYARRGNIDTAEFDADWLEAKIMAENRRYIRHQALSRPRVFLAMGLSALRANPGFVLRYVARIVRGVGSGS